MIRRLLIANRGEIAVRLIRACRELGIGTVTVASDIDQGALHAQLADRVVVLGPAPASQSYLDIGKVIDAARSTEADAVHPGYGFLSENAGFAAAVANAGLIFVGPPADVIERMGSKIAARTLMESAGVPVVPGRTPPDQRDESLAAAARDIGYPVLIKASAGGGGKGMRVVTSPDALAEAVGAARREAGAAFGDDTLYLERLVARPRHVEFQILADHHGHVVHLFERECSVQRRHQKVIEESPSPALSPALRTRMAEAAVAAARACGYRNAGTIEFLVDGTGDDARFYFLEMNTRLQVEHPVTEAVAGIDLVHAQLRVAAGEALRWTQAELRARGHAIECRVYAEDPGSGFLPQAGSLLRYREPAGPGIRVDSGVVEGSEVTVHYDPLLAKLIATAETRADAIARARSALARFAILGVRTNVSYLLHLLDHPAFRAGEVDTGFIEREFTAEPDAPARLALLAIGAAVAYKPGGQPNTSRQTPANGVPINDPWDTLGSWRTS